MEKDRKQIEKLVYLIVPIVLLWSTFCASFCYELGKHGLGNIDWFWALKSNGAGIVISSSLLYFGHKKLKIFSRN
jgi:hypothetical protein